MNWLLASWPLRSPVPPLAAPTARAKTAIFRGHASCLGKTAPPARGKPEEPGGPGGVAPRAKRWPIFTTERYQACSGEGNWLP